MDLHYFVSSAVDWSDLSHHEDCEVKPGGIGDRSLRATCPNLASRRPRRRTGGASRHLRSRAGAQIDARRRRDGRCSSLSPSRGQLPMTRETEPPRERAAAGKALEDGAATCSDAASPRIEAGEGQSGEPCDTSSRNGAGGGDGDVGGAELPVHLRAAQRERVGARAGEGAARPR